MNRAGKKKLRRQLDALAKQHGQDLNSQLYLELVNTVLQVIEEREQQGEYLELIGATSGDGFFEFDLKKHKIQ